MNWRTNKNFREKGCRLEKKLTMDEANGLFTRYEKMIVFKSERNNNKTNDLKLFKQLEKIEKKTERTNFPKD